MAEVLSPSGMVMSGGDGGLGFGSGGGLIGGLILGSLLRNGNGGLFGGEGGGVAGAVLRNPPEQNQANMDLMAGIGGLSKDVALGTAAMESSQATQSLGLTTQFNNITASLAGRIDGLKDVMNTNNVANMQQLSTVNQNIMQSNANLQQLIMMQGQAVQQNINNDGDKTRALITQQYEQNLTRQLQSAEAAIIELRGDNRLAERTRGIEVTTTNNINQMQQQSQQQQQYGQLYNAIWALSQGINATNQAINVGSGTQTANPLNNNTNIR
jgi:hypothetical protein